MKNNRQAYILDTSVLIHEPDIMYKLGNSVVAIPHVVIKQLDGLKNSGKDHVARAARHVSRTLDTLGTDWDISTGCILSTGAVLLVYPDFDDVDALQGSADNRVVGAALNLRTKLGQNVTVLTTDTNMRTVARSYGLQASFYPFGFDYEAAHDLKDEQNRTNKLRGGPAARRPEDGRSCTLARKGRTEASAAEPARAKFVAAVFALAAVVALLKGVPVLAILFLFIAVMLVAGLSDD